MSQDVLQRPSHHTSRRTLLTAGVSGAASMALSRAALLPLASGAGVLAANESKALAPLLVPLGLLTFLSLIQTAEAAVSLWDTFVSGDTANRLNTISQNTRQILNSQEQILEQIQNLRYVFREELDRGLRINRERDLLARVSMFEDLRSLSVMVGATGPTESQYRRLQEQFAALSTIFGTYGPEGFASFLIASTHNILTLRASNAAPEFASIVMNNHKTIAAQWIAETGPRSIMPLYNQTLARVRTLQQFMDQPWTYQISEFAAKSSDNTTLGVFRRSIRYDGWNTQVGAPRLSRITERTATYNGSANFPYDFDWSAGAGAYPFRTRAEDSARMACLVASRTSNVSMANFPLRDGPMNIDLVGTAAIRETERVRCIADSYAQMRRELVEQQELAARQLDFINAVRALMAQYDRGVGLVMSQRNVPQVPLMPNIRRG